MILSKGVYPLYCAIFTDLQMAGELTLGHAELGGRVAIRSRKVLIVEASATPSMRSGRK